IKTGSVTPPPEGPPEAVPANHHRQFQQSIAGSDGKAIPVVAAKCFSNAVTSKIIHIFGDGFARVMPI
ncbi:MAG: hypothetical protein K2N86_05680, partial [Rikenellaceae bacterium]|nr:hypothetical protein [Rikenellaceae bacterium]